MSRDFDLRHWLALTLAPSVGGESIRKLLAIFETPRAARMQSESALAKIVSAKIAQAIKAPADEQKIREALKWSEGENRKIVTLADDDYPQRLLEAKSPPLLLYARGDAALLRARSVAVVGSRNPSPAGANNAEVFARALAAEGIAVVSGLAQGIDAAAHTGALAADGRTIAVLGNGIDIAYPKENRELAAQIAARGLVVSEFALGMPPLAQNFPRPQPHHQRPCGRVLGRRSDEKQRLAHHRPRRRRARARGFSRRPDRSTRRCIAAATR